MFLQQNVFRYSCKNTIFISTILNIAASIDWTDISYEIGYAVIQWIYTNETPARLQTKGTSDIDSDENDSFVLALIRTAKKFNLHDLMNRCEESLVARVQVMHINIKLEISEIIVEQQNAK